MTAQPQMDATTALADLPVLVVDCQSTGANPQRGHLLEVAWTRLTAGRLQACIEPEIASRVVALPAGHRLPPRIRTLTGIEPADLDHALPPADVWRALHEAAGPDRLLVAHFARFERAFLQALHEAHGDGGPFPLDFLCTHEIVCRLLPGLPRRGLRAVAGYLGHVIDGTKRARAHVAATATIWSHLARRLADDAHVHTLDDLRAWLTSVPAERRTGRDFAVSRAKRLELPEAPGVYRMRAKSGEVLYLGKATSLRRRVNSYFQKRRHGSERTPELLTQVFEVDVTVTPSALEAALCEADEIKRRAPPYNLALRPRRESVCFARADLAGLSPAPDARHRLGPLPDRDLADAVASARALLTQPTTDPGDLRWRRALDLPEGTRIEGDCVQEGLHAFAQRHNFVDGRELDVHRVRGLGARLWRAHLLRRAEQRAARAARREEEGAGRKESERDWSLRDPEQVVRRLEATVMQFAHRLRRARWFLRLSESALRWRPTARASDAPARLLVFERGRLVRGEDVPSGRAVPTPPGADRNPHERRGAFDAATHDRLRVLTTELRRLVFAERDVELRFGPHASLDRAALARRLYWL